MESMDMDRTVGRMVMLKLDNWQELEPFGIEGEHIYARIVGVGDFGLWIENPSFEAAPVTASAPEACLAYILVSWNYVKSLVFFPYIDEHEYTEESRVKRLGFNQGD